MTMTNKQSGTNVHEVAEGIYRINTPVAIQGAGGFSFNQYLIVDDEALLFHTGPRMAISPTGHLVRSLTGRGFALASMPSDGSIRRTCLTRGTAAF